MTTSMRRLRATTPPARSGRRAAVWSTAVLVTALSVLVLLPDLVGLDRYGKVVQLVSFRPQLLGAGAVFRSAEDGIAYEAKMEGYLAGLEALPVPTLAVVEGFAIGGGLAIAACCDLRIGTPGARFGVPIARTLGNCLSVANYARLVAALGASRAKRVLLLAENLYAEEALAGGFLSEIVEAPQLDRRIAELCDRLVHHAPITMRVSKEAIRRLMHAGLPDGDDLVRACYGSDDFRIGVKAFVEKREPQWTGK